MAEDQDTPNNSTSSSEASAFVSGMVKDVDDTYIPEGSWAHARNATKVTANGSLNTLSNEPSTSLCIVDTVTANQFTSYTIIGAIHVVEDKWIIFSTNNTNSEIGLYDDSECSYTTMTQEPCRLLPCNPPNQLIGNTSPLGFNTKNLIIGASKVNFDCTYSTYFADGLNPDRYIQFDIETKTIVDNQFVVCRTIDANGCITETPTCKLNVDAIRLASLVASPCVSVSLSKDFGSLLNGSYFVVIAYTINQQVVTNYFPPSNTQSIFNHQNVAGALDISFSGLDTNNFDEFELVIVATVNQQTTAKKIGIYSTRTTSVTIASINEALPNIPIEQISLRTSVIEKSNGIYNVGSYLVKSGPTSRFDFNYQPLANRIQAVWQSVEYPADYYKRGGNNTGYLRDEIYSFFIRWIYDTGDRTSSYHIPGRAAVPYAPAGNLLESANFLGLNNSPGSINQGNEKVFEIYNTASLNPVFVPYTLADGGRVVAEGRMAYWESTERYPDNNPEVWNLNTHPTWTSDALNPAYQLCALPIRHHKMPDNLTDTIQLTTDPRTQLINTGGSNIRILGVRFTNIALPLDNNGNLIQGIVGYEILRGSREGNRSIIAKGIINNMRSYPSTTAASGEVLYQNYPYNFLQTDITLTDAESNGGWSVAGQPNSLDSTYVKQDRFTFHSPETQFKQPFLSVNELKLYGETVAPVTGNFNEVDGHPKQKLLTDFSFFIAAFIGFIEGSFAMQGQKRTRLPYVTSRNFDPNSILTRPLGWVISTPPAAPAVGFTVPGAPFPVGIPAFDNTSTTVSYKTTVIDPAVATYNTALNTSDLLNSTIVGLPLTQGLLNTATFGNYNISNTQYAAIIAAATAANAIPGVSMSSPYIEGDYAKIDYLDPALRVLGGIAVFSQYWTNGTDTALRLIYALVPYEQYAYSYTSHGLYDQPTGTGYANERRRYNIDDSAYLSNSRQFFTNTEINNLYRSTTVVLATGQNVFNPTTIDNTVTTIGAQGLLTNPTQPFTTRASSHYAGIMQRISNQYGQLDSIQQLVISCPQSLDPNLVSPPALTGQFSTTLFGGDIYINRYTEKNTFFYFYDWLQDQPDGYEYDYRKRYMVTFPRYWADFTRFEVSDFFTGLFNLINVLGAGNPGNPLPNDKAALDRGVTGWNWLQTFLFPALRIRDAYFYLFQSGVRDFFVESEINTAQRDWDELPEQRFYDPFEYTSLPDLFAPDIIKSGNYYKYDFSLSVSKLYYNFTSWGNLQQRNYNPYVANTCYTYNPTRLMYSLPDTTENTKDFWRVFLPNNYKDFYSEVSGIKSYNVNGAVIFFNNDSPILWKGVDTLETNIGTKITLGDGGLFEQPQQSIVNVDLPLEYGSCQDRLSVINTPFGLYYISAEQGKIFHVTERLDDITYAGLKFWFKEYLPYQLLLDFPDFDITANPVAGIGTQAIYDNQIETIYFMKRDYKLRPSAQGVVFYNTLDREFHLNSTTGPLVTLGDPTYFQDASWTVSYDPKSEKGGWISFHDWHPDLCIPSRKNFLTITRNSIGQSQIWRHNARRDDFVNYYGTYYPFELEYVASTRLSVNTLRSVEYYMECYRYIGGRLDRFHLLNWNFDRAIVYNTEQVSGLLELNLAAFNDPFGNLGFPNLTAVPSYNILYNKVEQKYRFDQFWDITNDRGEFTPSQQEIWITDPNGYTRTLNINNLDYNKAQTQRKKFRHYTNKVILTKLPPAPGANNPINMTVKVAVDKNLLSMR